MNFAELLLLAVGLSMDAFAVSVTIGLTAGGTAIKKALTAGLYFGVFQALMPVIGFFVASLFAKQITAIDHWVAFALLCFLGGRMIAGSFEKDEKRGEDVDEIIIDESGGSAVKVPAAAGVTDSMRPSKMLPFALATSIDAMAVGISFALLDVLIVPAVSLIGAITFAVSAAGVKIGAVFGAKFKSKAEFAGGAVLVLIGLKILFEGLGVL